MISLQQDYKTNEPQDQIGTEVAANVARHEDRPERTRSLSSIHHSLLLP